MKFEWQASTWFHPRENCSLRIAHDIIRAHAMQGGFLANHISEVKLVMIRLRKKSKILPQKRR